MCLVLFVQAVVHGSNLFEPFKTFHLSFGRSVYSQLDFYGKHSASLQLLHEDYSLK